MSTRGVTVNELNAYEVRALSSSSRSLAVVLAHHHHRHRHHAFYFAASTMFHRAFRSRGRGGRRQTETMTDLLSNRRAHHSIVIDYALHHFNTREPQQQFFFSLSRRFCS